MEKKARGFATISKEKHKEIASRGGRTAHTSGKAHHWTSETAKKAAYRSIEVRRAKMADRVSSTLEGEEKNASTHENDSH